MPTDSIPARVVEDQQNVHDWTTTWNRIETEIGRLDGEVLDTDAVLGDYDFQFVDEAPDEESAQRIAVAVERRGLDAGTDQSIDVERFGEVVEDVRVAPRRRGSRARTAREEMAGQVEAG